MPEIEFKTSGSDKIVAAHEKLNKAAEKGQRIYKLTAQEAAKLGKIEEQILKQTETARERYNRKLDQSRKALAGHKSEVDLLSRVEQKLGIEFAKSATEAERRAVRMKVAAGTATADEKKLHAAIEQTQSKFATLSSRIGDALNPGRITAFVGGLVGIHQAVAQVQQAFRQIEQDAQQAADRSVASIGSAGELSQLFSSKEDYQAALKEARGLVSRGVFKPDQESQAMDLVFSLTSAGYGDADRAFLAEIGAKRGVRPESLQAYAQSLKKFQDIFGQGETGDLRSIANKVVQTSQFTQARASEVAASATKFGTGARALGISDEDSLAAIAVIERGAPSISEASTRLSGLFQAVDKKGLKGRTIEDIVSEISAREASGENLFEMLGEKEAVNAYRSLKNDLPLFRKLAEQITAAPGSDILGTQLEFIRSDPEARSALARERAEGNLARGRQTRSSEVENLFDAYRAEVIERLESQGRTKEALAERAALWLTDVTGGERGVLGDAAFSRDPQISRELQRDIQQFFLDNARNGEERKHFEKLIKKLDDQTKETKETNKILRRQQQGMPTGGG
jgi:hypothetical protein